MFRYGKKFSGKDQMTKLQFYFSYGQNHNLKEINLLESTDEFPITFNEWISPIDLKPISVNQVIEHCDVKIFALWCQHFSGNLSIGLFLQFLKLCIKTSLIVYLNFQLIVFIF